ncbi:MAG TPA: FHA domain-containing protein [Anaeromyxobacter sp.]|nr:FHA domain-containing protein [Anaeromyxobacter sp.]
MIAAEAMRLVIEDEGGTRSTVPFTGDELIVGRAEGGVAFRLPDRNVSRRHARFLRANGAVHVEDLGSLTGTRVNGERITGRRRLREGDLVQIGDYDLALFGEAEAVVPGEPPPPPLPPTPRPPSDAAPAALAAVVPPVIAAAVPIAQAAPRAPTPRPAPVGAGGRPAGGHVLRTLIAAALALALGAAAGWAAGVATAPSPDSPPAITRP